MTVRVVNRIKTFPSYKVTSDFFPRLNDSLIYIMHGAGRAINSERSEISAFIDETEGDSSGIDAFNYSMQHSRRGETSRRSEKSRLLSFSTSYIVLLYHSPSSLHGTISLFPLS